ncbi:MAG: flagellar motor switch protein FliN [Verrucomicrobiales bacterium]|nr:flagellar motor switch protein FliN [Verrucomicrobiales bacterium]|tara:strand:+ start:492 stop:779 length:288 start_codon:yes stop_codon:yes gene_type:complete
MSTEIPTTADPQHDNQNLEFLMDVPLRLSAELGSCQMTMEELLELSVGSVVQLDKPANANVDVYVNQKLVARGEVVVAEDNFGIRIKEVLSKPVV